jgi:predicted DNA-binding transcriptional regulator AlpA
MNDRLWTIDDIGEYFRASSTSVYRRVVCKPDFPKAIKPEGFGRRWVPEEVKKWAMRKRDV